VGCTYLHTRQNPAPVLVAQRRLGRHLLAVPRRQLAPAPLVRLDGRVVAGVGHGGVAVLAPPFEAVQEAADYRFGAGNLGGSKVVGHGDGEVGGGRRLGDLDLVVINVVVEDGRREFAHIKANVGGVLERGHGHRGREGGCLH